MSPAFPVKTLYRHPILHSGPQKQRSQNFLKTAVQRPPVLRQGRACARGGADDKTHIPLCVNITNVTVLDTVTTVTVTVTVAIAVAIAIVVAIAVTVTTTVTVSDLECMDSMLLGTADQG